MAALETRNLTVTIGAVTVCRGLDLQVAPGTCWALLGRNGVGKTTLLHILAGLRPADSGAVHLDGQALIERSRRAVARRLGLLFQDSHDPFPATVLETALIGRHPHLAPWQFEGPADYRAARRALEVLGLAGLERRPTQTLSGGERRRLAMATLLVQDPEVLLLDEPTNHLDLHHQLAVLEHVRRLAGPQGKAALMSLHDVNLALRCCSHALLLLGEGEALHGPIETVITADNLERAYRHPMRELCDATHRVFFPD